MFDLDVTEERAAVAQLARRLGLDALTPAARQAERTRAVPEDVWRSLFDTGLTMPIDAAYGGGGVPDVGTQMIAVEGFAYGDPGIAMAAMWAGAAALLIGECGTLAQKAAYLPALAADPDRRSAVGLYEGFGRAPSESTTTISRRGAGWAVRGCKLAVPFAEAADPLVVVGTDPSDGRLRAAILRATGAGVRVQADDVRLALDAAPTSTVTFDGEVAEEQILGGAGAETIGLEQAVGRIRLMVAAALVGTAQRAVDYASKYATERLAFGRPLAAFQGVSFMLADAALRVGAARLEMLDAAAHLGAGRRGSEAVVTRAVNYAGAVATTATRDAVQVLGGHGFITDHPVELWYRSAAALSALDFDPLCSNFEPAL